MIDELIEIIHSADFEERDASIDLAAVRLEGDVLSLSINLIGTGVDEDQDPAWEVECIGILDHQLSLGYCQQFMIYDEHALLWPYIHPQSSVSFYGEAADPHAAVGALYSRHVELVGPWIPFNRYLNGDPIARIAGRYGMFAAGPVPLIEAYRAVFEQFGISASATEPKPAWFTNGVFTGSTEVAVLILGDNNYVVAQKFNATKLDGFD
jgi:hypothetical protein